jgi:hypothetical protein
MIRLILDLLKSDEWLKTGSEIIELAKGRNELADDFSKAKRKIKRQWQSRK